MSFGCFGRSLGKISEVRNDLKNLDMTRSGRSILSTGLIRSMFLKNLRIASDRFHYSLETIFRIRFKLSLRFTTLHGITFKIYSKPNPQLIRNQIRCIRNEIHGLIEINFMNREMNSMVCWNLEIKYTIGLE